MTDMMSPQGLAEQILPTRGAAQKATASFAEQLADSPGRSDGDSPSSANLFHEPAHRTKAVKYRYSATGKHLSSPLMGTPSSPERKQNRSKRKLAATSPSHAKAKAPGVASTSRKRKASLSPSHEEDLFRSSFLLSSSPLSSTPTTPLAPKKDLSPSPALTAKEPTPDPPKRASVTKTFSLRVLGPAASKASVLSQPLSPKRKQKKKVKTNTKTDLDDWTIGNSVWILINQSGVLADNNTNLNSSAERMWWPAQVVRKLPLRVSLFGDFPSSSSTSRGLCTIFDPSPSNVLSMNDDSGAKRFSHTTFYLTPLSVDDGPLTKKPRLDETTSVQTRWESAVQSMDKASTLEQDGLPALLSSYATTGGSFYDSLDDSDSDPSDLRQSIPKPGESAPSPSTKKSKPKRPRGKGKADTNGTTQREQSLCPPDLTLQIPGELVLALAPRTGGSYWPGKILEHVPARKEQYRIKFLDEEEHVVSRERFYTSEEPGFVQCTLGEWESAVKTTDDVDSGDEGGEFGADKDTTAPDATCPLPPPPPAEDFADLSARAQLAYVKPVLQAILNKEYGPALGKHEGFMKGGNARVALLKSAGVRGGMDARFVKAVQKAICEWVLGTNGLKPQRLDMGNEVIRTDGAEEGATREAIPSEAVLNESLPPDSTEDDKMEGVEGAVAEDVQMDKNDVVKNETSDLSTPDKHVEGAQDVEMTIDSQEELPVSLPAANGVALSPLAAKSQLDLLAEVSQAVATEPSLLPSHPEVPRLTVEAPPKDTSSQPSPLTPLPDEDRLAPPQRSGPDLHGEFEMLSGVEKLDYCLNILLPETVQQLLLWRSGERTSPALLSPEEEQKLHDIGARKAVQTDWVDDLMRLRAAQARLMGIDMSRKTNAEAAQGGTRSRPRPLRQ